MIEQKKLTETGEIAPDQQQSMLLESEQHQSAVPEQELRPRPRKHRTPFVIFIAENKDKYVNLGKNFLKEIGRIWTELDEDVKRIYIDKARAERDAIVADMSDMHVSQVLAPRSKFPLTKVRNILREDPAMYKKIRPETLEYVAEIVDVFAAELLSDALGACKKTGKRKLIEAVFEDVRKKNYKYRFLADVRLQDRDGKKSNSPHQNADDNEEVEEPDAEPEAEVDAELDQAGMEEEVVETRPDKRNTLAHYFKPN